MSVLPVLRPRVAAADEIRPLLERIDQAFVYTNHGPQETALRAMFAGALGGRDVEEVSLFGNGTLALAAVLECWGLPKGARCLVPGWTFVGTVGAVVQARLTPVFVDVDPDTWCPSPAMIAEAARENGCAAAVVVAPFGGDVEYDALADLQARSGLRILVDAAAGFDYVQRLAARRRDLPVPIMVSLHATKLLSAIEGGLVVVSDPTFTKRLITWSNFGIWGSEPISLCGTNAKLSEIHAAYGQLSLTSWAETRDGIAAAMAAYRSALAAQLPEVKLAPNLRDGLVSSAFNVVLPASADAVAEGLAARGIGTRKWWRNGVHRMPAYAGFLGDALPVSDDLAAHALGLPLFYGITQDEIARVVTALAEVLAELRAVA